MYLGLSFQPDLLGVMSQLNEFQGTLTKHLAIATEKAAGVIGDQQVAEMWMNFQNPTGNLADSVGVQMSSEYLAYIGPEGVPYAWRRDRGFSGMTDRLGRYYPHDPGIFYAEYSISDPETLQAIAEIYTEAIYAAWQEAVGSLPQGQAAFMSTA